MFVGDSLMGEGSIFSLFISPHPGGTPFPGSFPGHWSEVLSGGTPVLAGGRGFPSPGQGVPQSWLVGYLSPEVRPWPGQGGDPSPWPGQDGAPLPMARSGWGTPHPGTTPRGTERQSEHLLRSWRYASCVHAGGLSC